MRFRELPVRCECGLVPARIRQVGLSAQHQLVIHWRCARCKRQIYLVKDLVDCWRECPDSDASQQIEAASMAEFIPPDAEFLHSLGVKMPEGEES